MFILDTDMLIRPGFWEQVVLSALLSQRAFLLQPLDLPHAAGLCLSRSREDGVLSCVLARMLWHGVKNFSTRACN